MEQNSEISNDELTLKQQKEIEKEINEQFALISEKIPIEILSDEYAADDQVYRHKIQDISSKYRFMRKIRPDGNCFYRAFGFTTLEHLIKNKEEFKKFRQVIEESKAKLIQLNFPQFTIDDFYDTIMEVINKVDPSAEGVDQNQVLDELYKLFNEQAYSDYIVVYLRLITSGKLQEEADFYSNFIEGNYTSLLDFCKKEVEPMYKESDHIHIIAITSALNCGVRVVYMDRGDSEVIAHDFPDCPDNNPSVFLLYRPNHYDVLYQ